ncbi:MAG TPA: FAD-binding oxidoreductase [Stellaceae bacterium]|nr:FAD-binding oxidoreductase [Stellaceae bacterium]
MSEIRPLVPGVGPAAVGPAAVGPAAAEPSRRRFLLAGGAGLLGLAGCTARPPIGSGPAISLAPIRAHTDRIFDITVCLRPFRAAGPRLDAEHVGDAFVVHNYGHGGSGWSLSWGSGTLAVRTAMASSPRRIAVIGCGALGLTSAILAQRAGAKVTIYASEWLPQTRSARATGTWTPDSRIALAGAVDPGFPALWEEMARTSFKMYRSYLGLPGDPVEWMDRYIIPDAGSVADPPAGSLDFASYGERIADLTPHRERLPRGATPFDADTVYRTENLVFNVADYGHTLLTDFLLAGGEIRHAEFHAPAELAALDEKVVINCTGYGARALWRDESIVPVRGQIAWLIPQPEVRYALYYDGVNVVPRRDGIVVQTLEGGDMRGYGDTNETPDRAETEGAVRTIARLYERFGRDRGASTTA